MKAFGTHHGRWTAALFTGLLVLGLGAIGQADASEVVDGNPTCEGYDHSAKFEDPSGTHGIDRDGLHLTLTVGTYPDATEPNPDNAVVSYTVHADSDVTSGRIIVKGSDGAIIYAFGEATPLHSPTNSSGKWPTISHVQVCWNDAEQPDDGRIELTKVVTGDDAPSKTEFELCVVGPAPSDTSRCQTVVDGETATFGKLPAGTYTVAETDPEGKWVVSYSDETLTIEAGETGTATITNTWQTDEPEPARIELTKVVTGDDAPEDEVFVLCITGPEPADTELCGKAVAGDTVVFEDLEPGVYAVTETDPEGKWVVSYSDETLTIEAGETGTATITNTWQTDEPEPARIELTKVVTGDDAPDDVDFELCIVGPAPDDTTRCGTVGDGETAVFDDLEPGTYAVVETDPAHNWIVSYSDTTLTVEAGETGTATVTNTWETDEPELARIEVTKAVAGEGAPTSSVFSLCITGPQPDDTPQCVLVSAGQTAEFENLEPGIYTVTETDPAANWTVSYSDVTLTVEAGGTGTATVINTWEEQEQLPPTPTPTPTPPADVSPSGGSLPTTGVDLNVAQAAIAAGLLATGTVLLRLSRRPETTTS
jgi:hypothetical protein